jgi:hypothetical protein
MDKRLFLKLFSLFLIFDYWTLRVDCVPCKTMLHCQCEENESIVKCDNMIGLSVLSGITMHLYVNASNLRMTRVLSLTDPKV